MSSFSFSLLCIIGYPHVIYRYPSQTAILTFIGNLFSKNYPSVNNLPFVNKGQYFNFLPRR